MLVGHAIGLVENRCQELLLYQTVELTQLQTEWLFGMGPDIDLFRRIGKHGSLQWGLLTRRRSSIQCQHNYLGNRPVGIYWAVQSQGLLH